MITFHQGGFNDAIWILFSSGTTGAPKPIVHRAGGMLLQASKEHIIHASMNRDDIFFYFTTPGWMMFNYLISALKTGCQVVIFDGSPLHTPSLLWKMAADLKLTIFGTSAKYLSVLSQSNFSPNSYDLTSLRQILSTGSPLKPDLFDWVYSHIKTDVLLGSITGGTDICSLFAGLTTSLPVFRGEIQALNLGMAMESWDESGSPVEPGTPGDLVCTKPFPCMPLCFWGDTPSKIKYKSAYFGLFGGKAWVHGDYCIIGPPRQGNAGCGLTMLGRSDAVLNPSGVRFGSSEIYDAIEALKDSGIEDSLVIGQPTDGGADERLVLFLKMESGKEMTEEVVMRVKKHIRLSRSARHVPEVIVQVNDIPYTINNKKVEVPVKKLIKGALISSINSTTLRNPESLLEYVEIRERILKLK